MPDNLWVSDGSEYRKPNIAYTYTGTNWRRVKKVYVSNGATYNLAAEFPDWSKVAAGITSAAAGTAPHAAIFNQLIDGRKLGDITNDGTVGAVDALRATQFNSYALAAGSEKTYIENVIAKELMRNQAFYSAYYF